MALHPRNLEPSKNAVDWEAEDAASHRSGIKREFSDTSQDVTKLIIGEAYGVFKEHLEQIVIWVKADVEKKSFAKSSMYFTLFLMAHWGFTINDTWDHSYVHNLTCHQAISRRVRDRVLSWASQCDAMARDRIVTARHSEISPRPPPSQRQREAQSQRLVAVHPQDKTQSSTEPTLPQSFHDTQRRARTSGGGDSKRKRNSHQRDLTLSVYGSRTECETDLASLGDEGRANAWPTYEREWSTSSGAARAGYLPPSRSYQTPPPYPQQQREGPTSQDRSRHRDGIATDHALGYGRTNSPSMRIHTRPLSDTITIPIVVLNTLPSYTGQREWMRLVADDIMGRGDRYDLVHISLDSLMKKIIPFWEARCHEPFRKWCSTEELMVCDARTARPQDGRLVNKKTFGLAAVDEFHGKKSPITFGLVLKTIKGEGDPGRSVARNQDDSFPRGRRQDDYEERRRYSTARLPSNVVDVASRITDGGSNRKKGKSCNSHPHDNLTLTEKGIHDDTKANDLKRNVDGASLPQRKRTQENRQMNDPRTFSDSARGTADEKSASNVDDRKVDRRRPQPGKTLRNGQAAAQRQSGSKEVPSMQQKKDQFRGEPSPSTPKVLGEKEESAVEGEVAKKGKGSKTDDDKGGTLVKGSKMNVHVGKGEGRGEPRTGPPRSERGADKMAAGKETFQAKQAREDNAARQKVKEDAKAAGAKGIMLELSDSSTSGGDCEDDESGH